MGRDIVHKLIIILLLFFILSLSLSLSFESLETSTFLFDSSPAFSLPNQTSNDAAPPYRIRVLRAAIWGGMGLEREL
jgi:hypothetical protein